MTLGTETHRGFTLDNVLHSEAEEDVRFNFFAPESYDGSGEAALFVMLPGILGTVLPRRGREHADRGLRLRDPGLRSRHDYRAYAAYAAYGCRVRPVELRSQPNTPVQTGVCAVN